MKISKIEVIFLPVKSQNGAKAFYEDKLGFSTIVDMPMGPGKRWLQMALPGDGVTISLEENTEKLRRNHIQNLVLSVLDIEPLRADLIKRGVNVSALEVQPFGKFANFSDPDGNEWTMREDVKR
ncbi:MAG: VOC family protein [Bacteroidia bacterium]|nr:VOC family protein [Bacteroidia bacterium]